MPAIITSNFRVQNALRLVSAVTSNNVYITLGKSDDWPISDTSIPNPISSTKNIAETSYNVIAMKRVIDQGTSLVIPMIKFSRTPFKEWDSSSDSNFLAGLVNGVYCLPAYCVVQINSTSEHRVYKCLSNLKDDTTGYILEPSSDVAPTTTDYTTPQLIGGYLWAYMFTCYSNTVTFSSSFIPVPSTKNTNSDIASNKGKIYGYKVISGGAGYTDGEYQNVAVSGNGTGAAATIKIAGGVVKSAAVYTNPVLQYGSGYTSATIEPPVGAGDPTTEAVIHPLFTPIFGHGYDPANELCSYYATFATSFGPGMEDTDLPASNDFRQIGLLLNPLNPAGSLITSSYAHAQKTLIFPSSGPNRLIGLFPNDAIIYQPSTGALAFLDSITTSTDIRYHQNYSSLVNFKSFVAGSIVYFYGALSTPSDAVGTGSIGTGVLSSIVDSEYKFETGDFLFMENRPKITRSSAQTEDIKIVVQF